MFFRHTDLTTRHTITIHDYIHFYFNVHAIFICLFILLNQLAVITIGVA